MKLWNDENEKFALMREKLYTPVVGDILDELGYYHQFLPQDIRPLREDMKLAGKAMTVLMTDVYGPQKKPFGLLTEALDQLKENEIYIAAGGTKRCAYWGGASDCNGQNQEGVRRRGERVAQGYAPGAVPELAGIFMRLLCPGFQRPHPGGGF